MALREIMKKISPRICLMEGIRIPRCFNNTLEDRRDLNNKSVNVCDLEELLKDGWKVRKRTCWCETEIDKRWDRWVYSSHELWKEKNEDEQRRDLNMRRKYLKDLLNREGIETSHHRLLLSMIEAGEYPGTLELKIGSLDRGLVSINKLVIYEDRGFYTHHILPR
ncbi:hypothetical protein MKX03_013400 [Papaver bracteatum]|nr:hypothetical protein MKX03_013400 [Papaver bracteatum]